MVNFYRSWPSPGDWAENNLDTWAYVSDNLPRLIMSGQDYRTVAQYRSLGTDNGWPDDRPGFCLLEWDVALDSWGQQAFAALALVEPREILVAPYRWQNTYVHFVGNDGGGPDEFSRPINDTDKRCDSFGLGCIYIPHGILGEFLATGERFTDTTLGKWYRQRYGPVRLTWEVRPQHVHHYQDFSDL